jgi:hypothetical protein
MCVAPRPAISQIPRRLQPSELPTDIIIAASHGLVFAINESVGRVQSNAAPCIPKTLNSVRILPIMPARKLRLRVS